MMNYENLYKNALERARVWKEKSGMPADKQGILDDIFPELKESEDEKIRTAIIHFISHTPTVPKGIIGKETMLAWLEKQGEQKPTQEIEPFEAEHGKYYYCIKDYFCGGRKQASKGDIVQALRGLPIMGLKDADEYFLPVNSIKCNSAWSEEDSVRLQRIIDFLWHNRKGDTDTIYQQEQDIDWLKSLKQRIVG